MHMHARGFKDSLGVRPLPRRTKVCVRVRVYVCVCARAGFSQGVLLGTEGLRTRLLGERLLGERARMLGCVSQVEHRVVYLRDGKVKDSFGAAVPQMHRLQHPNTSIIRRR